jgi:hypothetical protein
MFYRCRRSRVARAREQQVPGKDGGDADAGECPEHGETRHSRGSRGSALQSHPTSSNSSIRHFVTGIDYGIVLLERKIRRIAGEQ